MEKSKFFKRVKLLFVAILAITSVANSSAQSHIKWACTLVKEEKHEYKIIIKAKIDDGYLLYALHQPPNSIASPFKIHFETSKSVDIYWDDITEVDTKIDSTSDQMYNEIGLRAYYYTKQVCIIIPCHVLGNIMRAYLTGSITYQSSKGETGPIEIGIKAFPVLLSDLKVCILY